MENCRSIENDGIRSDRQSSKFETMEFVICLSVHSKIKVTKHIYGHSWYMDQWTDNFCSPPIRKLRYLSSKWPAKKVYCKIFKGTFFKPREKENCSCNSPKSTRQFFWKNQFKKYCENNKKGFSLIIPKPTEDEILINLKNKRISFKAFVVTLAAAKT